MVPRRELELHDYHTGRSHGPVSGNDRDSRGGKDLKAPNDSEQVIMFSGSWKVEYVGGGHRAKTAQALFLIETSLYIHDVSVSCLNVMACFLALAIMCAED